MGEGGRAYSRRAVEVVIRVLPGLTPAQVRREDRLVLQRARAGWSTLSVSTLTGDVVSLGRFHLVPPTARDDGTLWRRCSGGRVVPCGDGFVVLSLALPHRSALESGDRYALEPEQVLNRCVRGLLDGLASAGVSALYPGRDVVTAGGRPLALVSFDVDEHGAVLFEAVVAVERDFSALPAMLDRVDPAGVVRAALQLPDAVTSVARETGRAPALAELAEWIRQGYASRFGFGCVADPGLIPVAGGAEAWLRSRLPRPALDRHGWSPTMLGTLEAYVAVESGVLREVMLAGDFIAPPATIAALEEALRSCAAARDDVQAVVDRVFTGPDAFVLGIGPVTTITDTLMRAIGA